MIVISCFCPYSSSHSILPYPSHSQHFIIAIDVPVLKCSIVDVIGQCNEEDDSDADDERKYRDENGIIFSDGGAAKAVEGSEQHNVS